MDEITKEWLEKLSQMYPNYSISITHQFLSGTNINPAGFVPNVWNGKSITIKTGEIR